MTVFGIAVSQVSVGGPNGSDGSPRVLLWGFVLTGVVVALRSILRTASSIAPAPAMHDGPTPSVTGADETQRLVVMMEDAAFADEVARIKAASGGRITEQEAIRRLAVERSTKDVVRERERLDALALAYEPVVTELRATMSAKAWNRHRAEVTRQIRASRAHEVDELRRSNPPGWRVPEHLDPELTPDARDWQVAAHLKPVVRLDPDGWPVADAAGDGTTTTAEV